MKPDALKHIRDLKQNEMELELEFWWVFKPANFIHKNFWPFVVSVHFVMLVVIYWALNN